MSVRLIFLKFVLHLTQERIPERDAYSFSSFLQEDMSYGGHIIRDNILTRGHVIQKNLTHGGYFLLKVMSYGRICLTRGHVLQEASVKGRHVLKVDISYRRMFFWTMYKYYRDDMSYWKKYFMAEMYYSRVALTGGYILWDYMSLGVHVLLDQMS